MTGEDLQKYFVRLENKQQYIKENMAYAYGHNYEILNSAAILEPDNKIPIPLAKSTITDIVGYAGKSGELSTDYRVKDEASDLQEDELIDLLSDFDDYNNEDIENSELLTRSLSLGSAWELWWVSDNQEYPNGIMTPEYKILDNRECYPVYTKSLKPELEKFIRFYGENGDLEADVYYPLFSEHWVKTTDNWTREEDLDTTYPYTMVPVIPFRTSVNNSPVFEAQRRLIDTYDMIVSKTQNEVDRYNALITLFPGKVDAEFINALTTAAKPYIDSLDEYQTDQWPKYLEKNLGGVQAFYESQANRVKSDYYETIKVPNFMDENFAGGNQSGLAIALKLMGLEFLVSEIEIYFRQGLKARFLMYQDVIDASTLSVDWDLYEQIIVWNRNLPVDAESKLKVAAMLKGLGYSAKGINDFLPSSIIDEDIEAEELEDVDREGLEGLPSDIGEATEAVKLSGIQITAANEIIGAVNRGELSREAGINQLVVFLGLTREQAEKVMGKVVVVKKEASIVES